MSQEPVTVSQILSEAERLLEASGVDAPRLSAQVLTAHALGLERTALLLDRGRTLGVEQARAVGALIARRATGEPVAYIMGRKEFFGLDFAVSPAVLVPRPETEHLVEEALRLFPAGGPLRFADLGTGSGCLAVVLAREFPEARGLALDTSPAALDVARANAVAHAVNGRLTFVSGDFGRAFAAPGSLDLVVSNPPYVAEDEFRETSPEVHAFEPRAALVPPAPGDADGLECYRALVPNAARALRPGGALLLEIGWKQGRAVADLARATGLLTDVRVLPDLAGHDRVVAARRA